MGKLLRLVKEQADAEWPEEAFSVREEPAHQVPSYSNGVVLSPETYNYRTRKPEKKGLYSEEVFGAVEGSGEFMDDDRAELWGHIELSAEVPHPRGGEPLREIAVMPPTYRRFRRECEEESQERARLERDRVMNGASECEDLPSQVLGEAGLWNHDEDRPLTDEEIGGLSGSIVEPQVGGHYRRVVNLSRRLRRLREMMAPEMVLSSNEKSLGRAVHALFFHVEAMELPGEVRDRACGAER